jgi:hypothetical protein
VEDVVDKVKDILTLLKTLDNLVNETNNLLLNQIEIPAFDFSGIWKSVTVRRKMKIPDYTDRMKVEEKHVEEIKLHLRRSVRFTVTIKDTTGLWSAEFELGSRSMRKLAETILFIRENYETLKEIVERLIKEAEESKREAERYLDEIKKVKALLEIAFS